MIMFDFYSITKETDLYNLHTHTQYCDGHATIEEFVHEAIAQGFTHLGFTPHSPISVESPVNMSRDDVQAYFDEIISVKEVPRGKPFPDVYLFACEKLGLRPEECLAIEDSPNGIRSAYRAGTRVVMVPDLTGPDEELAGMCTVVGRIDDCLRLIN